MGSYSTLTGCKLGAAESAIQVLVQCVAKYIVSVRDVFLKVQH